MPALYTHFKFGNDVYNKFEGKIKNKIKKEKMLYDIFNQGWDNLFYYHKKWNYYKNLAIYFQTHDIKKFFKTLINYIIENNKQNDIQLLCLLFGFINHYICDTLIHPLVDYQENNLNITHGEIEFMIDRILRNNGYSYKELIPKIKFSNSLKIDIDNIFFMSYNLQNAGKIFERSHNNSYYIYKYFIEDKTGLKTKLYKFVDFLTPKKDIKLHKLTYYFKEINYDVLNDKHNNWQFKNKNKVNYSFYDLYEKAILIANNFIKDIDEVINNTHQVDKIVEKINKLSIDNISQYL